MLRPASSGIKEHRQRLTPDEKLRFTVLADARGISESALALIAIRDLLSSAAPVSHSPLPASTREPAIDRITIRLRPGDRQTVRQRAAQRGMKDSGYLAALVRAHVAANPPLAADELRALKLAVTVLAVRLNSASDFNDPFEMAAHFVMTATEDEKLARYESLARQQARHPGVASSSGSYQGIDCGHRRIFYPPWQRSLMKIRDSAGVYCFAGGAKNRLMWNPTCTQSFITTQCSTNK